MSNCAKCFHPKENHKPVDIPRNYEKNPDDFASHICTGSINCDCQHFEEAYLVDFVQEIEKQKSIRKTIYQRCFYILDKIAPTRNAGEKTFAKIYNEIWYGFKIRAKGTNYTLVDYKRLPNADTVNREKRRVKQANSRLQTYDPLVIGQQTTIFQAYLELAAE